jgi:hypothetical protein
MARPLNVSFNFNVVPLRRALALMVNGLADSMLGPNRNSEREAYMFYIDEELPRKKRCFLHKKTPNVIEHRYLFGFSISVLREVIYYDKFNKDDKL